MRLPVALPLLLVSFEVKDMMQQNLHSECWMSGCELLLRALWRSHFLVEMVELKKYDWV